MNSVLDRHLRLEKMISRLHTRRCESGPLALFLVEADAKQPVGMWVIWNGRTREIAYDSARGEPRLPPGGFHKFNLGRELEV